MELFGTTVAGIINELGSRSATVLLTQLSILLAAVVIALIVNRYMQKGLERRLDRLWHPDQVSGARLGPGQPVAAGDGVRRDAGPEHAVRRRSRHRQSG